MKLFMRRLLRPIGLRIIRLTGQYDLGNERLRALKRRGLEITFALDAGAATGAWARELRAIFPNVKILCVEPRAQALPDLRRLAEKMGNILVAPVLLAEVESEIDFSVFSDQSSMMKNSKGNAFGEVIKMPTRRLDSLIEEMQLPWPEFLKFDVQGAELRCLAGAPLALSHAQAVLLEIQFLPLYSDAPLAADVIEFMRDRGFRLFDLLSVWRRPGDRDLAFSDALFLREGHPLLKTGAWSADAGWEK